MYKLRSEWLAVGVSLALLACGGDDDGEGETGKITDVRPNDAAIAPGTARDGGVLGPSDAAISSSNPNADSGALPSVDAGPIVAAPVRDAGQTNAPRADESTTALTPEDKLLCETVGDGEDSCAACTSSECCAETIACFKNIQCAQMMTCVAACAAGATACISDCQARYPRGAAPVAAMTRCATRLCADECSP